MNMGSLIGGMSLVGPNGGSFLGGGGGMGMSISPGYGHWVNQAGPSGTHGAGGQGHQGQGMMGMSFTQMGSFLNPSSMTDPQIGPGPAGSSVNSAMLHGFGSGNQGIWGVGVGGERSRELEKRYVRDFTCCGLKLGGLHDLLEQ
jgi:transcription factor SFP1